MSRCSFEIQSGIDSVQLWLERRLPFDPRGDLRNARNSLKTHISNLRLPPKSVLLAQYLSLDESFCDVENVLIYNVGPGAFAEATRTGLRFERKCAAPPVAPSGQTYAHYHRYSALGLCDCADALPPNCLAFSFSLESMSSTTKPHEVWWAAGNTSMSSCLIVRGCFEIRIRLACPAPPKNVASLVKPLVDGVISALHSQSVVSDGVLDRLEAATGWPKNEIRKRLIAPQAPVLGEREVVTTYRSFVKWNPADDLCTRCTVLVYQAKEWRCHVEVCEAE